MLALKMDFFSRLFGGDELATPPPPRTDQLITELEV